MTPQLLFSRRPQSPATQHGVWPRTQAAFQDGVRVSSPCRFTPQTAALMVPLNSSLLLPPSRAARWSLCQATVWEMPRGKCRESAGSSCACFSSGIAALCCLTFSACKGLRFLKIVVREYVLLIFFERGTGRGRERNINVRNIDQLLPVHILTRNRTCNVLVFGTMLQPTEPPGQG